MNQNEQQQSKPFVRRRQSSSQLWFDLVLSLCYYVGNLLLTTAWQDTLQVEEFSIDLRFTIYQNEQQQLKPSVMKATEQLSATVLVLRLRLLRRWVTGKTSRRRMLIHIDLHFRIAPKWASWTTETICECNRAVLSYGGCYVYMLTTSVTYYWLGLTWL